MLFKPVFVCLCLIGVAVGQSHQNHTDLSAVSVDQTAETKAVEVDAALESLVGQLLKRHEKHPPSHDDIVDAGLQKMNVKDAARRIEHQLPEDMASLVRTSVDTESQQPFAESSLAKARKYLNALVVKAWKELDDKLIGCKEFEDKNRVTFKQVMTQIATLAGDLADLAKIKAQATEMINVKEQELIATKAMLKKETDAYMKIYLANKAEMQIRKDDLAVFTFMLKLVACKKGAAFAQLEKDAKICEASGGLELRFDDMELQAEYERKLTPSARAAIREILGTIDEEKAEEAASSLVQQTKEALQDDADDIDEDDDDDADDGSKSADAPNHNNKTSLKPVISSLGTLAKTHQTAAKANQTEAKTNQTEDKPKKKKAAPPKSSFPRPPAQKAKVQKTVKGGQFSCKGGPVDCGLLHDNMSLMWGKFKDLVDELQATMDKNEFQFKELKANLNAQMDVMRSAKAKFILELNEAIANIASTQEELAGQQQEAATLEKEYKVFMKGCKKKIEWIMFQDICAYIKVRAKVMKFSKVSPPEKIVDCGVSAWIPGECSVPCDDKCPDKQDPYKCGGMQTLTREVVVKNNKFGLICPMLSRKRKCNQIKCPVNCKQSRWSRWSKCSKDCEGGSQSRTRSVLVQPKNGGQACNTAAESRPCNTGSCDRNCKLKKWTQWSPCSVACGGGFTERARKVIIPIRGNGKCPKLKSRIRYGLKKCNTHKCRGDEVCVAKQDLILSIDGSGSLREKGFKTLKAFVAKLVEKYKGEYYGFKDMQIGIVQFGNGRILKDGTIADAKDILPLSSDMKKVKKAVDGMVHLKGFTNMAQAFGVAEKLLLLGGRKSAQSAVMTITDGKPSFLFQTNEKVLQLKDKHTKLFFVPITEFKGKELKLMKKWASAPWPTNLVHIPGLDALGSAPKTFVQKCLVMFCPEAISPSSTKAKETTRGYMLIREHGLCGKRGKLLSKRKVAGAADCAALAAGAKLTSFSLGTRFARGRCYGMKLKVKADMIKKFNKNRAKPPCPGGKWRMSGLYDFYVLIPAKKR